MSGTAGAAQEGASTNVATNGTMNGGDNAAPADAGDGEDDEPSGEVETKEAKGAGKGPDGQKCVHYRW